MSFLATSLLALSGASSHTYPVWSGAEPFLNCLGKDTFRDYPCQNIWHLQSQGILNRIERSKKRINLRLKKVKQKLHFEVEKACMIVARGEKGMFCKKPGQLAQHHTEHITIVQSVQLPK